MDPEPDEISDHYRFRISLRLRHPNLDPQVMTDTLAIHPKRMWQAGLPRSNPKGGPLGGFNEQTYWTATVATGNYLTLTLNKAIYDALNALVQHREFLHRMRSEGGSAELFIGWSFNRQSGDVLSWPALALAGDLRVDLSLDIYPPDQPQNF